MWPSDRRDAIQPAFDALLGVVDEVFLVDRGAVERAKSIVLGHPRLSARDAVHLAVMQQHGVTRIMSFDAGFDTSPASSDSPDGERRRLTLRASRILGTCRERDLDADTSFEPIPRQPRTPAAARSITSFAPAWIQGKKLAMIARTPIRV
jgi:PIN domain-containing protein